MRLFWPVAGVVLLLAACTAPPEAGPPPTPDAPPAWRLDCDVGPAPTDLWKQACTVRASGTDGPKQEIWLDINPTNPDNVVLAAKDNRPESSADCVWNGVFVTRDAGESWTDVTIGGTYESRTPEDPWYGYACNTDPMFAFNGAGALHYVMELYNLGGDDGFGPAGPGPQSGRALFLPGWKILLVTSFDGGLTWPRVATLITGDGGGMLIDYSHVVVNPRTETVLTAINTFEGTSFTRAGAGVPDATGRLDYSYCNIIASRDEGATAEVPVAVSDPDQDLAITCRTIEASANGTVVLGLAESLENGRERPWWSTSADDGATFAAPAAVGFDYMPVQDFEENEFREGTNFEAAYDRSPGGHAGRLYFVYAAQTEKGADVFVRWSDDDARAWSEAVRVTDDVSDHDQWMPNVAVAADGSVHVVYMDKRWDEGNKLIDVTHAVSLDGGATWTNTRITNASFDGDLGVHQEKFPFFGDYIGLAAVGEDVWAGYPDASNGLTTVVAAAHIVKAS